MKALLTYWIRRKNPNFQFDKEISNSLLFGLLWSKLWSQWRALRLLWWGHSPWGRFFGTGIRLYNTRNIQLGRWVQLEDQVYLSALGRGKLILGDGVRIGAFSRLIISTSFNDFGKGIRIGNNVGLGEFAYLGGAGGLEIGDDCIIGQYLSCHPENHRFELPDVLIRKQGVSREGIQIGKNCWIGAKVTILDGVTIGEHCVIAAGAVVTRSMPSHSLIGGVPARVIRRLPHHNDRVAIPTEMPIEL